LVGRTVEVLCAQADASALAVSIIVETTQRGFAASVSRANAADAAGGRGAILRLGAATEGQR
jgi:hypothetical protein